jgi:hypothetical protein
MWSLFALVHFHVQELPNEGMLALSATQVEIAWANGFAFA